MRMRSVMAHAFSQIPRAEIPRSSFDRSHAHKTTFDSGYLIPVFVDEALPGDTFNMDMTAFARLATPLVPIMDNLYMDSFFFAVPMRLLWDNWERFNGAQDNPDDSVDFVIPTVEVPAGGYDPNTIFDYMGLPTYLTGSETVEHSVLPLRAYNLIYNEWFRDENLQDSVPFSKGDSAEGESWELLRRGKRHDYFTSCLPWPQKGDAVSMPIGASAPVSITGNGVPTFDVGGITGTGLWSQATDTKNVGWSANPSIANDDAQWNDPKLTGVADLSAATAATINQLRQAFQVQRLLERDARGGTRYTEIVRSHFGVISPDARLQRPEYLGGGSSPVQFVQVPKTAQGPTDPTPQGDLAAYATATMRNNGFTKSFTEHCIIIGMVSVRADLTYQDGLNRMWSRSTRYDFYWPALSHIGEQAVLNKEIFCRGEVADAGVFGYQERYAEYRYKPSLITGSLRSTDAAPLDYWHLSQQFNALPVLGPDFIVENPPVQRIIAVPGEKEFIFDSFFNLRCARPMPLYGVPGMIDHF